VKIHFPLELTDQPIGLEDSFARTDRVKTMLTPFFPLRRCHHHHFRAQPADLPAPSFRVCEPRFNAFTDDLSLELGECPSKG